MKYILIIIAVLIILTACQPILQADTVKSRQSVETIVEIRTVKEYITVEDTTKIDELESNIYKLELELKSYRALLGNLNSLLKNVYYIECKNSIGGIGNATAFSINYNNKIYILSAGHLVENENGKFSNFRIKYNNKWIYLKLLDYNNNYLNRNDYAILYSDKIDDGFVVDTENDKPEYILGYNDINTLKDINIVSIESESGSPIIDIEGEIVGISTTDMFIYYTDIDKVLDKLK